MVDYLNGSTKIAGSDIRFEVSFEAKNPLTLQNCQIWMIFKTAGFALSTTTTGIVKKVDSAKSQIALITIPAAKTRGLGGQTIDYYFKLVTQAGSEIIDSSYLGKFTLRSLGLMVRL